MYGGSTMSIRNKKAFTLIEMLVVVVIIGILATIALPQYQKAVEKARAAEALINLKALREAWGRYNLTYGTTATTIAQLADFDIKINIDNSSNYYAYSLNPQGAIHAERKPNARHRLIAIMIDFHSNRYKPGIGILCDEKIEDNRGTCTALGATRYLSKATNFDRYIFD
ncbi:MAG: prepilin-type N-terminal cleavage/methylation domain-containing protein [Elusimicrobiota bacterium]|nr:prepilin-type N-terminal cleavage/methylation domain-containing protein [Elusimicrobiota bacterium]